MPFPPGHIWDTIEKPPFGRVSTATVNPKSENDLQETRLSHTSAAPRRSRNLPHRERWAYGEYHKQFQDKTTLKYALLSYPLQLSTLRDRRAKPRKYDGCNLLS